MLLRTLELLQTLHDGAIGKTFLVLHCRHSTVVQVLDMIPDASKFRGFVLRRAQRKLQAATVVGRLSARSVRVLLNDGGAGRDQI